MRNVLFVLYCDFASNSALHVHSVVNELCQLGFDCAVAVPENKALVATLGRALYRPLEFGEAETLSQAFANGEGPQIVHSWTPREIVRQFCERLSARYQFKQFIHLEDNEEHLVEKLYGQAAGADFPLSLSHPVHYRQFLQQAAGVTVIIEKLRDFVPTGVPVMTLWPGVDPAEFYPRAPNPQLARQLNLPIGGTTIVYPGNVHAANAREVRSLYLAVAMLNREGHPTCLVRTGQDFCEYLGDEGRWVKPYVRELGFVARERMPEVLALADLFVQPGRADRFNEYRFPSKLPEFLAMGKPVILPASNIGRAMTNEYHACLLEQADAVRIVECVKRIHQDRELQAKLSAGAIEFAQTYLSWPRQAARLRDFYLQAEHQ
ncbi:MAG: glycosyltransferase [Blastocatellia bacterium]